MRFLCVLASLSTVSISSIRYVYCFYSVITVCIWYVFGLCTISLLSLHCDCVVCGVDCDLLTVCPRCVFGRHSVEIRYVYGLCALSVVSIRFV